MRKVDIHNPNSLKELGPPALRAFEAIADAWELSNSDRNKLLGLHGDLDTTNIKSGQAPDMNADMLLRISYILGIYGALHVLFPNTPQAAAWLRAPNAGPLFAGRAALEKMTSGNMSDLKLVRQYLEAECM